MPSKRTKRRLKRLKRRKKQLKKQIKKPEPEEEKTNDDLIENTNEEEEENQCQMCILPFCTECSQCPRKQIPCITCNYRVCHRCVHNWGFGSQQEVYCSHHDTVYYQFRCPGGCGYTHRYGERIDYKM